MRFGHICIGYLLPALPSNMATVGLVIYLASSLLEQLPPLHPPSTQIPLQE